MHEVIHIVDRETPLDLQRQLALLAGGEPVFSLGPAPDFLAGLLSINTLPTQRKVGPVPLGQISSLPPARVVHVWTSTEFDTGLARADSRIVVSLPASPPESAVPDPRVILTLPTPASARLLVQQGFPVTHVAVLPPPAVAPDNKDERRRRLRSELGLSDGQFVIVAPGELVPAGGQKYVAWVLAILLEMMPDLRLIIPDSGPYEPNARYFSANTGCTETQAIFLSGKEPFEDCLCAADAAVFLPESDCGIAALAATMAAGLPIVAANTPDIAWAAPDGKAALLVPPRQPRLAAAAILRLIDDPSLARSLGDAARARVREAFDPQLSARARAAIYAGTLPLP